MMLRISSFFYVNVWRVYPTDFKAGYHRYGSMYRVRDDRLGASGLKPWCFFIPFTGAPHGGNADLIVGIPAYILSNIEFVRTHEMLIA
jgi:hypothetical protein